MSFPVADLLKAMQATFYMVSVALSIGFVTAMSIALLLVLTNEGGLLENKPVFYVANAIVNLVRSVPFIILMVFIFPLTKFIVGTRIGANAALVPMTIFISMYMARLFENSLLSVDKGIIEAAKSMGASYWQIIRYFILPEAKSSLILSVTMGTISLISATAQAGTIGAGGIGDMALTYGYERLEPVVMFVTVLILVLIVQTVQSLGNYYANRARNH